MVVSVSVRLVSVPPTIVVPEPEQESTVIVGKGLLPFDDFRRFTRLKMITTTKPTTNKTALAAEENITTIFVPEPLSLFASTRILDTAL
jgi:hypothetical protein